MGCAGLVLASIVGLLSPLLSHLLGDSSGALEWLVDLIANWQWLFLLILICSTAFIAFVDRRWAMLILVAPLPLLTAGGAAPFMQGQPSLNDPAFSIASANVYFRNQDVKPLARWLEKERPDVVVLLEVSPDFAKELPGLQSYPHRHVLAQRDAYGLAILSRHPLVQVHVVRDANGIPLIQAKVRWKESIIGLAALHPMWPQALEQHVMRNRTLQSMTPAVTDEHLPSIVAGDLNATPWSNAFSGLQERGWQRATGLTPTWPAFLRGWLGVPIDHVLVNCHWAVASSIVGPTIGSDHLPVLVKLAPDALASRNWGSSRCSSPMVS